MKTFVLDTNVLLHNPQSVESFTDNEVVLPMAVIEELDKFKTRQDELGRNARQVVRRLDQLRGQGSLRDGVPLNNAPGDADSGSLRIVTCPKSSSHTDLDLTIADDRILYVAYTLHQAGNRVIFVSKDINVRVKADAMGVEAVDFEKQKVNFDELYTGYRQVEVPGDRIEEFYDTDSLILPDTKFFPNEYVLLVDESDSKHSALARAGDPLTLVPLGDRIDTVWNVRPRSKEQRMALDLLMNPDIQLVTLVGHAGTGKTLLALAAALESVVHANHYERVLVTRPIIPLGKDIGYLPGGKEEKLANWMQPIYDNLEYLMHNGKKDPQAVQRYIDELLRSHKLQLEALTYIRGRNIPRQYVILDEAQNLTPHEVKTVISRAGDHTKMVLTGDPYQIDNPYLDSASNGLTYTIERLKSQPIHGHITLRKSERSMLAAVAAEFL